MLDANSTVSQHALQNLSLLLLSVLFLPLDTFVVTLAWLSNRLIKSTVESRRDANLQDRSFKPRNILVTGVGMSKGLALARSFYEAGHNVIGADLEENYILVSGRVSKCLASFHGLQKPSAKAGAAPYIQSLLSIVEKESIDIWVSCSGVASAVEDGEAKEIIEARTSCKAVQFDAATTQKFHEKHSFISHIRDIGLQVPETHTIESREAAETALSKAPPGRKFIMKPIGVDDARRGDMTLLPRSSAKETKEHLSKLQISEKSPWILQQFIDGPEYCTHALVVKGEVKVSVACPSAELLMHYVALPTNSALTQAMLRFTERVAEAGGASFTGHLSFDFMIENQPLDEKQSASDADAAPAIYPIECNPRAHTAVVLFNETPRMAEAYLSLLEPSSKSGAEKKSSKIVTPAHQHKYYWIGHDLASLLLQPLLSILSMQQDSVQGSELAANVRQFLSHLILWRDGTFERWDPWPFWWLYHVYWPMQFVEALRSGKKWSRLNVSTTKMFEC